MVWENHPNSKQLPWQLPCPISPPSIFTSVAPTHSLTPPPPLLSLYHITLVAHKSAQLPRVHTQTWSSLPRQCSDWASRRPSPWPSHMVYPLFKKKINQWGRKQQGLGGARSLSISSLLYFAQRVRFHLSFGAGHHLFYKVILEVDKTKNWNSRKHDYEQLNANGVQTDMYKVTGIFLFCLTSEVLSKWQVATSAEYTALYNMWFCRKIPVFSLWRSLEDKYPSCMLMWCSTWLLVSMASTYQHL